MGKTSPADFYVTQAAIKGATVFFWLVGNFIPEHDIFPGIEPLCLEASQSQIKRHPWFEKSRAFSFLLLSQMPTSVVLLCAFYSWVDEGVSKGCSFYHSWRMNCTCQNSSFDSQLLKAKEHYSVASSHSVCPMFFLSPSSTGISSSYDRVILLSQALKVYITGITFSSQGTLGIVVLWEVGAKNYWPPLSLKVTGLSEAGGGSSCFIKSMKVILIGLHKWILTKVSDKNEVTSVAYCSLVIC